MTQGAPAAKHRAMSDQATTETRRRSYEPGHRPKYMVIVDGTPECAKAIRFAARRAVRIGGGVVMLAVAHPPEAQDWIGVEDLMKAEAQAKADAALKEAAAGVRALAGLEPERVVRLGKQTVEIMSLIAADTDISFLVLATGAEGPGPLVSMLTSRNFAGFKVPVVIVPGSLADADIDALA